MDNSYQLFKIILNVWLLLKAFCEQYIRSKIVFSLVRSVRWFKNALWTLYLVKRVPAIYALFTSSGRIIVRSKKFLCCRLQSGEKYGRANILFVLFYNMIIQWYTIYAAAIYKNKVRNWIVPIRTAVEISQHNKLDAISFLQQNFESKQKLHQNLKCSTKV